MISRLALATCGLVVASMAIMSLRADDTKLAPEKVVSVINEVEGTTTIRSLVPAGTHVKKGQLICELDSRTLQDKLANLDFEAAKAKSEIADLQRIDNITKIIWQESKARLEHEELTLRGEVQLSKTNLAQAKDKLSDAEKGKPRDEIIAAKIENQRAEIAVLKANGEWRLFQEYTKLRQNMESEFAVKKAEADVAARISAYERLIGLQDKFRRQIELCKIHAPIDGKLVYPQSENSIPPVITEGASVREWQLIFRIIPD